MLNMAFHLLHSELIEVHHLVTHPNMHGLKLVIDSSGAIAHVV